MVVRLAAAEPLSIPSLSAKHSGVAYGVALGFAAALHTWMGLMRWARQP